MKIKITYQELRNNKRVERLRKRMMKELDPKKYYQEQREESKKYSQEHKEELKQKAKKFRQENPGYNNEYYKQRRKIDINFRIKSYLRGNLGRAFREYSKKGKQTTSKKYGINFQAIIEQLKPFPEDIENYHIDHIIPLSWFDFNNPQEIKWAFAPENH